MSVSAAPLAIENLNVGTQGPSDVSAAAWYRALTLAERAKLDRSWQNVRAATEPEPSATNRQTALWRARRWREQPPFDTSKHFANRLRADGLDEQQWLSMLSASDESLRERCPNPPDWIAALRDAFDESSSPLHAPRPDTADRDTGTFLNLVHPLIVRGFRQFEAELNALERSYSHQPYDRGAVVDLLLSILGDRLTRILGPTLVLELNIARLEGQLDGDTSTDRFASFVHGLLNREVAMSLLSEYPVAARLVTEEIAQWIDWSVEFLRNLCADWSLIREQFSPHESPGVLANIVGAAGDGHRRGRSVLVVEFQNGLRIVYKPRSLAVEAHFQQLLDWLNRHGAEPAFRTLRVLDRGDHGWVEFIEQQACASREEVRRFYERQGAFAAIFYALEANDFHSENLVAAGEHPVPIDLETLCQPLPRTQADDPLLAEYDTVVGRSVLRSGLLPRLSWAEGDSDGVDVSGLGGRGGQRSPDPVRRWTGEGTDQMTIQREPIEIPADRNQPRLAGAQVDVLEYADAIERGFVAMYRLLESQRDRLLAADGPLDSFANDEVRVVLRDSRTYGLLLRESYHPDLLHDALDRDRHLDRLWTRTARQPEFARVVPFERLDLQHGDIPIFTSRPNSRDLWTGDRHRLPEYFSRSGSEMVRGRILALCDDDLHRQVWLLRGSLSTMAASRSDKKPLAVRFAAAPSADVCAVAAVSTGKMLLPRRDRFLEEACYIGDQLLTRAIRGGAQLIWTGVSPRLNGWTMAPTGADLYSGLPGIALFFGYLGAVTHEARWTRAAEGTLESVLSLIDSGKPGLSTIGAFSGWGGILYSLAHLGTLWQRPELFQRAEDIAVTLAPLIDQDLQLDVLSGSAGCLAGLLSLHAVHPSQLILDAAMRCGDRLVHQARRGGGVANWLADGISDSPLTGFSHGAAGIAWALHGLHAVMGDQRFDALAEEAIAFERSVFCPRERNWPDYRGAARDADSAVRCAVTWCHGAPGIGLARLRMSARCESRESRENMSSEIQTAIQTTLEQGFGFNHSLCHGDLGNLEFLWEASRACIDANLNERVQNIAEVIVDGAATNGWSCGIPMPIPTPGLMTGLAGIGYELLRLAEPNQTPSLLALDPPRE
jgi:type 2 lantibiotic biosynthesis protein LanM